MSHFDSYFYKNNGCIEGGATDFFPYGPIKQANAPSPGPLAFSPVSVNIRAYSENLAFQQESDFPISHC